MSSLFDGPIPGQSLTQESSSIEQPPQYANIDDALEYLFDKLTSKRQATRLVLMLKDEVPVEYIARAIVFEGFLQNKWSPDSALLMLKIVMAMIIAIGKAKGVNPKIFNPDEEQDEFLDQFAGTEFTEEEPEKETIIPEELSGGLLGVGL